MSRVVGNFILHFKRDEILLCSRENRLFISLHLFLFRSVSAAPMSRISVKEHLGDFHENLLGKHSLVKIDPKFSVRYYNAIKSLPTKEAESGC
jgi:hypothetical protein